MGFGSSLVPDAIRESYLRKFTFVVVVVMVIGAVMGVLMTGQVSALLASQSEADMQTTAELSADAAETWVESNKQSTRMIANYEELLSGDSVRIQQVLDNEAESLNSVVDIHHVSLPAGGTPSILTSTDRPEAEANRNISAYDLQWSTDSGQIVLINDTSVLVSNVYERDGVSRIAFISTVQRGAGNPTALMLVANASDIAFESATDGSFTQAVGSSGVVQLASDGTETGTEYRGGSDDDKLTTALGGDSGVRQSGAFMVAYAPVEGTDWAVLSPAPLSNVFQLRSTVQLMMGGLIVVFLLGFVVVGATIGRNTVVSLQTLTGKAEKLRDGNLSVDVESDRTDEIGKLYAAFAEMRDSLERQIKESEVARAEAVEMNNYLQDKADEYATILQQAAAGDLTSRLEQDGESEAMDRIAAECNEMLEELEKTTGQLKSFADEVETAGNDVKTSADTVREASEQVADSIQRVSDDAYDQRERLQTVSETMDEVATDLETFAAENPDVDFGESLERIEEIATMLNDVSDLSEETMAEAENVAGAAEEQAAELNEVSERANDLSRYARPLQEVLDRFETESEHEFYFPTGPGGEANVHGED